MFILIYSTPEALDLLRQELVDLFEFLLARFYLREQLSLAFGVGNTHVLYAGADVVNLPAIHQTPRSHQNSPLIGSCASSCRRSLG